MRAANVGVLIGGLAAGALIGNRVVAGSDQRLILEGMDDRRRHRRGGPRHARRLAGLPHPRARRRPAALRARNLLGVGAMALASALRSPGPSRHARHQCSHTAAHADADADAVRAEHAAGHADPPATAATPRRRCVTCRPTRGSPRTSASRSAACSPRAPRTSASMPRARRACCWTCPPTSGSDRRTRCSTASAWRSQGSRPDAPASRSPRRR